MNPLTNVRNIAKLNDQDLSTGRFEYHLTWHYQYKDSAYIFIGGLPYDLTEGDILCVFSQFGEIVNLNLVRDKKTGKSKGYAFLCYEDQRSTVLAVDNFNGVKLGGRTIRVDHVEEYRRPKGDEKDESGRFVEKIEAGCAPEVVRTDIAEDEHLLVFKSKKVKKEKKKRKKKKEKRRHRNSDSDNDNILRKEQGVKQGHSDSDVNDSVVRKNVKLVFERDRGYDDGNEAKLKSHNPAFGSSFPGRKRTLSSGSDVDSDRYMNGHRNEKSRRVGQKRSDPYGKSFQSERHNPETWDRAGEGKRKGGSVSPR